jgi:hypothetical protein
LFVGFLVAGPLGLSTELYTGPAAGWAPFVGGVLYIVFWTFIVLWIRPSASPWWVAAGVFGATCGLEALQLWHPAPLEAIRDTFVGHALLGSTFAWTDFPHYATGAVLAGPLGRALRPHARPAPGSSSPDE